MFGTIVHPTDFSEPAKEAFRVARSLARSLGARLVVFHAVAPPAAVTQDGRVLRCADGSEPVDLFAEYRTLQADAPNVPVQYAVVVGDKYRTTHLLEAKIRELGEGVLVVMGSHGRAGIIQLLWGGTAQEAVRDCPCPVMVVKAPAPKQPAHETEAEAATSA
jgi:nucleotide-binding universal stress UspA family protein